MKGNWYREFADLIGKQNPLHFYALAQILKVEVKHPVEKGRSRPFPDIFKDVMEKIGTLNRKQKRDLTKVLRDSALTKDELKERKERQAEERKNEEKEERKTKEEEKEMKEEENGNIVNNESLREV